jgi:S-adenosylmethionine:tRNA ribosyltransferase-isomerase
MRVSDFSFELPEELIARYPKADRTASRLMAVEGDSGSITDGHFSDVLKHVNAGDLLVFNNISV